MFAQQLQGEFNNVHYLNCFNDDLFSTSDFRDADHLNSTGAAKFSLKLDTIIQQLTHQKQ